MMTILQKKRDVWIPFQRIKILLLIKRKRNRNLNALMWLPVSFINGNTRKKLFPVLSLNAWGTLLMMIAGISYPRRSGWMRGIQPRCTTSVKRGREVKDTRGSRWCPTCSELVSRDRNACKNIFRVYETEERPRFLCRKGSAQRYFQR
jgi:hypothetical protein